MLNSEKLLCETLVFLNYNEWAIRGTLAIRSHYELTVYQTLKLYFLILMNKVTIIETGRP